MSERHKSDLQKKIEQAIKRYGGDSNFGGALMYHLYNLKTSKPEAEIETRMEMDTYLFSKLFLDKMDMYPMIPFECKLTENSDWPLRPLPSELFGEKNETDEIRKMCFIKTLKVGDVLDCRVSSSLTNSCHLRVIHKYGVPRLLDDLNLSAELCCTKNEFEILGKKALLVGEYVRVAVSNISKNDKQEEDIHVTIDKNSIQSFKILPKLGRITENCIASYVFDPPDTEKFSSYSDYLKSKPQFQNPHFFNKLHEECGIDPKIVCSYFPEYNRKECIEAQTGQALLKESKLAVAKNLTYAALRSLEISNYDDCLRSIEDAIELCPSDDPLMSQLYEIRANAYAGQSKQYKSICDLEMAFKVAPNDAIKHKLLHQLFKVANAYYRSRNYKKAVYGFEKILKHDPNHRCSIRVLNRIKDRHADQLVDLEEIGLTDLQEKKSELLSELKKIS